MQDMNTNINQDDLALLFQRLDKNKDGKVYFNEVKLIINSIYSSKEN